MSKTIDINNFNAFRRTKNPSAADYVSQGSAKDASAIDWANKNGYDNSKVYTTPAIPTTTVPPVVPTAAIDSPVQNDPVSLAKQAASEGKSWVDMYNQTIKPPVYDQPRANSLKTNANLSVISDIVKLIGEGVTTSQGGRPIQRQSQAPQLNANLQQLNDLYKREVQGYKANQFQYMVADERDRRNRVAMAERNDRIAKSEAQRQSNSDRTFIQNQTNSDRTGNRADKTLTNTVRHDKVMENKPTAGKDPNIEKNYHIIIDGKSVPVPISYINDVAARAKSATGTDVMNPVRTMQPSEAFTANWKKYYNYADGNFVPKASTQPYQPKQGEYRDASGNLVKKVPTSQISTATPQTINKPSAIKSAFEPGGANSILPGKIIPNF